jgi:hypothetical protein
MLRSTIKLTVICLVLVVVMITTSNDDGTSTSTVAVMAATTSASTKTKSNSKTKDKVAATSAASSSSISDGADDMNYNDGINAFMYVFVDQMKGYNDNGHGTHLPHQFAVPDPSNQIHYTPTPAEAAAPYASSLPSLYALVDRYWQHQYVHISRFVPPLPFAPHVC